MKSPQSLPKLKKPKLPFAVRRVQGSSMNPTLKHGQVVFVWRWARPLPDTVVLVRHNGLEKIKRLKAIEAGQVFVVGDNPDQSTDSRQFGWLPISHVQGRVAGRRLTQLPQKTQ